MHIVIVDTSRVALRVVAGLLEPRGHRISTFEDSEQALACITSDQSVRAVITSLEVEPLSGLELCWHARLLQQSNRPLSIIVMSSTRSARTLAEVLDSGADDFIEKPPTETELLARLRAAERLTRMQIELIRLADTDPLTGLLNRRAFSRRAQEAIDEARPHESLALILADIDHFKRVNDGHGHDVGDAAIQAVAGLLKGDGASEGVAGRLGGEEFALLLPRTRLATAEAVAARLRCAAAALAIPAAHGPIRLTCSFGLGIRSRGESLEALLKRADTALYEAKAAGRNRVVCADSAPAFARSA